MDARGGRAVKAAGRKRAAVARALAVALALAACDPGADAAPETVAALPAGYDADSAARGLLAPELASVLALDTVLDADWLRRHDGKCVIDTLPQLKHLRRRIDAPLDGDSTTVVFARWNREGELRRAEAMRIVRRKPLVGIAWDAATGETIITRWPTGGANMISKTTVQDPDEPVARAMRWVGRRANLVACDSV